MCKKFYEKYQIPLLVCLVLSSLHLVILFLGNWYEGNAVPYNALSLTFSILFTLAHIAICIALRIKKSRSILRGILLYQMLGMICYVVHFILLLFGIAGKLPFFLSFFRCWTLPYQPLATLLTPLLGVSMQLRMGILYTILVIITGKSFLGIQKDIVFEEKIAERHALEEESARRRQEEANRQQSNQ